MIHPYNDETQTLWDRGVLAVQLVHASEPRTIGFCDGTAADAAEFRRIARARDGDRLVLVRRVLESGREVWTLGGPGGGGLGVDGADDPDLG